MRNPDDEYHPRLTKQQRLWILKRDNYQCQFIILDEEPPRRCGKTEKLHTHHIIPVDWGYELLKQTPQEVNRAENVITLCEEHHMEFIHPDYGIEARKLYKFNSRSYQKITEYHQALRKAGIPYWNTIWDDMLRIIARIRTWQYQLAHPNEPYPEWREGK